MPEATARERFAGYLLLAAGMSLVGVYVALSKPLTAAFPVFLLAWLRFAIAAVAMLPWLRRGAGEPPLSPPLLRTLFLQSLFGNFLFSIFMLHGVALSSATASGVILATLPAMVALFSWLFLRERPSPRVLLAVAVAVAGIAMLGLGGAPDFSSTPGLGSASGSAGTPGPGGPGSAAGPAGTPALGSVLLLACVACEALYVILGKRLTASLSARRISALINLYGLALMTPFGLWQARGFDFAAVTAGQWGLLLFYALAASMVSTWLWLSGLKHVPAQHSGVFTVALPVASATVGVVWLGERFTAVEAMAFGCAALGIALVSWPRRRAPI
ncbi:MAG: DMT family transporter [Burkholderiaceae bacterium]